MYKEIEYDRHFSIIVTEEDLDTMYNNYCYYSECAPELDREAVIYAVDSWISDTLDDDIVWTISEEEIEQIEQVMIDYINKKG